MTCEECALDVFHHCDVTREARRENERRYVIVRHYRDREPNKRVIARDLTLAEAQAHCSDPETSSSTATSATAWRRTKRLGPWFDGYQAAR